MATLIDGYNLLYSTGILGHKIGPKTLRRARSTFMNTLAATLSEAERQDTTVVFDAQDPPPGRPRELEYQGITVRYAVGYDNADQLMEELIRADHDPRRLVVVSSDHWIQQAAKRRRATAIDSEIWYDRLSRQPRAEEKPTSSIDSKPVQITSEDETAHWLEVFTGDPVQPVNDASEHSDATTDSKRDSGAPEPDFDDPFPPGYADDLLKEMEE